MYGLRVIWRGVWSLMLHTRPDDPEDDAEEFDDGGLSTGDHMPPRGLRSPIVKRDKDTRGPHR